MSGLNVHEDEYITMSKEVKSSLNNAKAHYEDKLVDQVEENPKRFYNYCRNFTRTTSTVEVLEENGQKITDDNEKANLLNDFFISVLINEEKPFSLPPVAEEPEKSKYDLTVTPEEVRKKTAKIKNKQSSWT